MLGQPRFPSDDTLRNFFLRLSQADVNKCSSDLQTMSKTHKITVSKLRLSSEIAALLACA